ncbi:MAG: GNAT family N-acetyltransferase, partial [Hyphomonadaceae bacterium]
AKRGEDAKSAFKKRVKTGAPPGVLAYAEGQAVGWLQIGPRADAPQWNTPKRLSAPLPDAPETDERVWAATCFFVRRGYRGKGVTQALLEGGVAFAKKAGARIVEACPHDGRGKVDPGTLYVGQMRVFERAGFAEVARRKENRPLMRLELKKGRRR